MSNPTAPGAATVKRLFALSGNRCAFPKCTSLLVDGTKVVGKICHIKAQSKGGPRYDPNQTQVERHGYDNLILMCGRHHDVIDADGIGACAVVDPMNPSPETNSAVFAFTTGELWSVDTSHLGLAKEKKHLYFLNIAQMLVPKLRDYGQFLQSIGIQPPFKWIAGMEGIKGWRLKVPPPPGYSDAPGETCLSDVVEASGTYDLQQPRALALRPFFNQLFRKCGMTIPPHIDALLRADGHL
jgi:hypothetical protein